MFSNLPQSAVLEQANIDRWLGWMKRNEPERLQWHIERLRGFGGSDIGAVVRGVTERSGSGFSTLERVIEQKLMKRLPFKADENMIRGTVLEELARLATMYRYGAVIDRDASKAMRDGKARPGYEWLVGNEDDFLILSGRRFLTDYKVPSSFDENVDFDYECQLHHYNLKARMANIKTDGMLLIKLDLATELGHSLAAKFPTMDDAEKHALARMIAKTDVPGMRVVALGVEHKQSLDVDILEAGRYAWEEYVLNGVVPLMDQRQLHDLDETQTLNLGNLQQQYAMAKAGIKYLDTIVKSAEAGIKELLTDADLTSAKLPVNLVNVKAKSHDKALLISEAQALGATPEDLQSDKPVYSVKALVDEIKRLNGDETAPHLYEQKADPAKAKAYLEQLGTVDMDSLREPGVSISLSRKQKDVALYGAMEEQAEQHIEPWLNRDRIEGMLEQDLGADHDDQLEEWMNAAATGTQQEPQAAEADQKTEHPMIRAGMR